MQGTVVCASDQVARTPSRQAVQFALSRKGFPHPVNCRFRRVPFSNSGGSLEESRNLAQFLAEVLFSRHRYLKDRESQSARLGTNQILPFRVPTHQVASIVSPITLERPQTQRLGGRTEDVRLNLRAKPEHVSIQCRR